MTRPVRTWPSHTAHNVTLTLLSLADGRALFKLMPPETLRQARDDKLAAVQEKAARKAATAAAAEAKRLERLEKGRTPPSKLFATDEFSAWDEQGVPTLDKEGVELPKSRRKKLQKEWDGQKKCVRALGCGLGFLADFFGSRRLHDEFLKESSK